MIGACALRSSNRTTAAHGFALFCASLAGLGVYPQALHRADFQHLLQVIYPFIVTLALLAALLVCRGQVGRWLDRLVGAAAIVGILADMLILLPGSSFDLGPLLRDPATAWETVADLPNSRSNDPIAAMAIALRRLTPPDASVFLMMVPTDMPLLFFSQRSQPGIFPVYERGMFAGDFWLQRNRAALEAGPPDYIVVMRTSASDDPAPFIPALVREWRSKYKTVLYQNERYQLLIAR